MWVVFGAVEENVYVISDTCVQVVSESESNIYTTVASHPSFQWAVVGSVSCFVTLCAVQGSDAFVR